MFMLVAMKEVLERAIHAVGSQAALAKAIGVKPQHVWNWLNRDKRVPAEQVLAIEAATGGKVSRHELRPDLYPDPGEDERRPKVAVLPG
jgi:DNA-binding transcriptional regulator YdaS (Cro superfamily)